MVDKRETKQKKAIEQAIKDTNSFFNAEEIYKKIQKENPNLGIATVYRFLRELQKERKIHSFICERKNLYSKKGRNHCHFFCEICGLKKHIELNKIDFLRNNLDGEICHFQIEVSGICKSCKSK